MSATSEPMLPFDEEVPEVRVEADDAATVRLKPDTTDVRSVRLQPPFDEAQGGPEALEGPDRDGSALRRTLRNVRRAI